MNALIDRRSEFEEIDDETGKKVIHVAANIFMQKLGKSTDRYFDDSLSNVRNPSNFIINSYYLIGMIDYSLSNSTPNHKRIQLLEERAVLSAALQYYIDNELTPEQHNDIFTYPNELATSPNTSLPPILYHGRGKGDAEISGEVPEVTFDDLGKPNSNGKRFTRDGLVYSTPRVGIEEAFNDMGTDNEGTWSINNSGNLCYTSKSGEASELQRCSALWYSHHNILGGLKNTIKTQHPELTPEEIQSMVASQIDQEIKKRGQVLTHTMDKEKDLGKIALVPDTHGGVPFMFQDQLYEASKCGAIKWLIPSGADFSQDSDTRADVINIENYADFVDERDKAILRHLDKLRIENA